MPFKEAIQQEINRLDEAELEELYQLILEFIQAKRQQKKSSLMAGLKQITIDDPVDFAAKHTHYAEC